MNDIKVYDDGLTELMECVKPCYNYTDWTCLVKYTKSMRRYGVAENCIQLKYRDHNKRESMYIDGSPKATGNIAGFINSTRLATTNKQPNCIFEGHEGNHVFVCAIISINERK